MSPYIRITFGVTAILKNNITATKWLAELYFSPVVVHIWTFSNGVEYYLNDFIDLHTYKNVIVCQILFSNNLKWKYWTCVNKTVTSQPAMRIWTNQCYIRKEGIIFILQLSMSNGVIHKVAQPPNCFGRTHGRMDGRFYQVPATTYTGNKKQDWGHKNIFVLD